MQEKYNVLLFPIEGLQDTNKIFLDNHISARNHQISICLQYIYIYIYARNNQNYKYYPISYCVEKPKYHNHLSCYSNEHRY